MDACVSLLSTTIFNLTRWTASGFRRFKYSTHLRYTKAQTALQGRFSVPFQMAAMVIRRKAGIMEFTDEFVRSPAVQDMMDRVETVIDPEIDALGKDKLASVIEVRLKDGRVLREKSSDHYREDLRTAQPGGFGREV